jgi:hypothetical protein
MSDEAREKVSRSLRAKGIEADPFAMSGAELDEFLRALGEFELEAGDDKGSLRIFVE